jgi:long-chain acyl-CoA synthetase
MATTSGTAPIIGNKSSSAQDETYATGGPRLEPPGTLNHLFFDSAAEYDKPDALMAKSAGAYRPISHRTLVDRVRRAALGLRELGIQPGDRLAILSENRPEWAIADYACLTAGLTDVPLFPTLPAEQLPYILNDAGAVGIFVSNADQAAKIAKVRDQLPGIKHVIGFGAERLAGTDMTLAEVEQRGAAVDTQERAAEYRTTALAVDPDHLATLIYTSGTTGQPKGVMLSHDNIYSNVMASRRAVPFGKDEVALSFLPLSHIFERMGDYMYFSTGTTIAYAESVETVPQNMIEVRPTMMMSVPRLYEKMFARVLESALAGGALKKRIFFWARSVADRWADVKLAGGTPRGLLAMQYAVAQKLVFSKLKERTGGRLRYFVSGGAPLAPEINKFFYAAGLVILEGYGLTETSPVITVNTPTHFRLGTVGRPVVGVEVRIESDGEILTRGPNVMKGYYNKPDATRDAIDPDGWFHTGDIGRLEESYLRITDRKKDIIVTANGKNIAPQPIENAVKTNQFVTEAVMIGDRRKFPVMLIVPSWDPLEKWASFKGLKWSDRTQLLEMPDVKEKMAREVSSQLSGLANFETPKRIGLLEHEFSIDRGELTPKLSVKRRVIDTNYKKEIDQLYDEAIHDREDAVARGEASGH